MGHRHEHLARLPPVFIDSGAWIDAFEQGATVPWAGAVARRELGLGKAHTSDYVILEAYSFIARNHRREKAMVFLDVATGPEFILHPSDADLVDRATARARERPLKRELNLVDWTTALLMEEHGIQHILSTDRGFAQLGFHVLP